MHKTILITRPSHQAERLAHRIRQLGGQPLVFPTLNILPVSDTSQLETLLPALPEADFVVFSSANAVSTLFQLRPSLVRVFKFFEGCIMAIGPGTASALVSYGLVVDAIPTFDYRSEGLLALPLLQKVEGKRIAIISGVGGRTFLFDELKRRGAIVVKLETYSRVCPNADISDKISDWQSKPIDAIVTTSFTSLYNLYKLVGKNARTWLLCQCLVVASERLQKQAINLGFRRLVIARNATDDAILKALELQ